MRATHEPRHGYVYRSTGPRREPPAVCYRCGEDVPETPRFGNEAICDACQRGGRVEPWLCERETR